MSGRSAVYARDGGVLRSPGVGVSERRQDLRLWAKQAVAATSQRRTPRWPSVRRKRPWGVPGVVLSAVEEGLAQKRGGQRPAARLWAPDPGRARGPDRARADGQADSIYVSVHPAGGCDDAPAALGHPPGPPAAPGPP